MKKIYLLSILAGTLASSCDKSESEQNKSTTISGQDSVTINTAFVPPFTKADSIYTSLRGNFGNNEDAQDFLTLNYGKALIMTGRLGKADTLINTAVSRSGFDTTSLANARYANLQAAIQAYKQNQEGAISYYKKAIQLFEKHNDQKSAASVNFNIANIFLSRLNYPMAYQYSAEATKGFSAINDTLYYPSALAVNAVSAILLGKKEEAQSTALLAKERSEKYKNPLGIAMSGYALAEIYMYDKAYDAAIDEFQKVIPLAQQLQQVTVVSAASTSLVKAYIESKNYDSAIEEAKKAIEFSAKFGYQDVSYALNRYISQAYLQKGNERESLQYLRKADEHFRDEVVNNDRRVIGELLVQYETEKKEKQIAEQALAILKKSEQIRNWSIIGGLLFLGSLIYLYQSRKSQKQKMALLKQENENAILKAIMSSEERERRNISSTLHDSVAAKLGAAKMSLQSIPFLAEERKNEQLEKTAQLISTIHADVRSVAHNLLPVTLEKEGLIPALAEFVSEINQLRLLEITFENQLPPDFTLPKRNELVLYRIVQELINNVVKHAKASQATVKLSETGEELEILVSDNGIGFSSNQENQGLYSIRERIHIIGGYFSIESKQEKGSVTKLTLKRV